MNKILKNTLILTAITLIAGLGLGLVHEITLNPIAQAQEKAKKEAWQAVFPDAKLDEFKETDVDQKAAKQAISDLGVNATIDEVCTVGDTGYVITTTDKDGYGGDIQVSVGIQSDGTVTGFLFGRIDIPLGNLYSSGFPNDMAISSASIGTNSMGR